MKYSKITGFLCSCCYIWVKGKKCSRCGRKVQSGDSCQSEDGGSILYGCYTPPRPLNMTPIAYRKKYGCVDENYTRVTNGRYYCNPAHCNRSWKDKKKRDEHLEQAYKAL